jgi:cytochrome c oxidase subunit 4
MLHHALDLQKHVKIYILVFAALAFLTVVTVLVSYLRHNLAVGITIALFIATVKGSLVACYFMHLISERKMIYTILLFTGVCLLALMVLILASFSDQEGVHLAVEEAPIAHAERGHVP